MAASAIYIFYTILNYYDFEEAFVKSLFIENYLCKWNDSIPRNNQSQYIIHLCYNGVLPHDPQTKPPTINEMKIRSKGRNISLTFEELAEIPDAEWLKKFDASVYDLYPQTISARDSIRRILMGLPLLEHPVYNPTLHYLQVPSETCPPQSLQQPPNNTNSSTSHDVVIIYKSAVYNFQTRQHLRQLFNFSGSGLDVHLVFSVGLPKSSGSNVFQRDGFNVTLGGRSGKLYKDTEEYRNMTRRALDEEMRRYGDLIVGNYEDTYFNLTLKMFYTFQWAARFCRPYHPTFVFNDDDFAFNTQKLMEFIRSKSPQQRETLNHGLAVPYNPVHRPRSSLQQWAFSKREIPWPIHVRTHLGIYSIWGFRHVHDMALAMHFTKPLVVDDIWLAMVQLKLGITFTKLDGMLLRLHPYRIIKCEEMFFAPTVEFTKRKCKF
uniref:Hexosyltransferase n=1 Tax=Mesocestoides corti TaxID=53468 RepID=A0A5K3EHV3_MESCO